MKESKAIGNALKFRRNVLVYLGKQVRQVLSEFYLARVKSVPSKEK